MEQTFESILKSGLALIWGITAFVFVIVLLLLVHDIKQIPKSNKKRSFKQKMKRILCSISGLTVLFLAIDIWFAVSAIRITVPVMKDIDNGGYCSVHGDFVDVSSSRYHRIHVTSDDGESFKLKVPGLGSHRKGYLPTYDEYSGTMWYSKNSQYALVFVPDKGDWRFWEGQDDWR